MLTRLLAAHPSAQPALLGVLAEHQLQALDPATTRSLLAREDLPAQARRHAIDAIVRTVHPQMEPASHDVTPADILLLAAPALGGSAWRTVTQCLPAMSADLATCAVDAPVWSPFHPEDVDVLCTIAAQEDLPADLRARALTNAARVRPLTLADLGTLATIAGAPGTTRPALHARGTSPTDVTLLRAAGTPYPADEPSHVIAERLAAAFRARSGDTFLMARCVLLHSGPRAEAVAHLALAERADANLLDAIAATPTLSHDLRNRTLASRLAHHGTAGTARLVDHITDLASGDVACDLLLTHARPEAALARPNLCAHQIDAVLDVLRSRQTRRALPAGELPTIYAGLAALRNATAEHCEHAAAAVRKLRAGERERALAVIDAARAGRRGDLPVRAASDLTRATAGLRHALDAAVAPHLAGIADVDHARALMLVIGDFTGTVDELFDLAATIAA